MTPPDEFDPPVGEAEELAPDLRRVLAPNPSPMTYRGTNTYLVGRRALAVIDPGPDNPAHLEAILAALTPGQSISHIFVTHAHLDHSPLAASLSRVTGAPVLAYGAAHAGRSEVMQGLAATGLVGGGEGVDAGFSPDQCLKDGEVTPGDGWSITAHWTPGHFGNHMSFTWNNMAFCGDLVMGWASSLVSPPDGDLTDFRASCQRLAALKPAVLHTGHGAPVADPDARIAWLLAHRQTREEAILAALRDTARTAAEVTRAVYTDTPRALLPAAERNVLAHLVDLHQRARVAPQGQLSESSRFQLI